MRQLPRVSEFNKDRMAKFVELRKHLNSGRLPTWMLNPALILTLNEHLEHPIDVVSLDQMLILAVGSEAGFNARALLRSKLERANKPIEPEIHHNPGNARLHTMLDAKEAEYD